MLALTYSDIEAATALVNLLGNSRWEAVVLAKGYLAHIQGGSQEDVARLMFANAGSQTLTRYREIAKNFTSRGFLALLPRRKKLGSAENPVTKLFPGTITEERFVELLEDLCNRRPGLRYRDDRQVRHGWTDFTLIECGQELPINIKNAGTRFEKAAQLVGLDPDDCIPIPAYKAFGVLKDHPNLLYVVSVDYELVPKLNKFLPTILDREEQIVWDLLNKFEGPKVTSAEDEFILKTVRKYWGEFRPLVESSSFHVISARKAVRILQALPHRTPGIGLRAWGTGARAEVNVHVSIQHDTVSWTEVAERIVSNGLASVIQAVNRSRYEIVWDPEI